ncbi:MAG: response regulator receiver [Acidimicrobiales bacterium]|nr:response regulator receiver [Acidimicrobiales bacterium]
MSIPFRVVIADDNEDVREILTLALVRTGKFEVVDSVEDGDAAIKAAARLTPDLVLLDLAMPGTSGLDALPDLRRVAPNARIVVVSGFPGDRLGTVVRDRGAVGYVQKGLSPKRTIDEILAVAGVLDAVEEILARSQKTLAPDVGSSAAARRFMEETLRRWSCGEVLDVVNLLVSELVTNAVVHGGSEADVSVILTPSALRVEVGDRDEFIPAPKAGDDDWATSGRGLALVELMAQAWGTEQVKGGKVIWFEVARPDGEGAGGS